MLSLYRKGDWFCASGEALMTPSKVPSRLVAETQTYSLPGDSTLLIRPTTTNDILAVSFVLPMGSREEPEELAGLTTLGLRMLTRGTRNRSDFDIAVALESLGASFSTDVQKDRTTLTIQTTGSRWKETFRIIRELLTESIFPEEAFEIEKEILIKEIREDLDSPFTAASRLFQGTFFHGHPYSHPGQGSEETVQKLTLEQAKSSILDRLGGVPVSIGAVGAIEPEVMLESMVDLVSALPNTHPVQLNTPRKLAPRTCQVEVCEQRSTEAECMIYGFPAPHLHEPNYAVWRVLDSIVGGSMDSRLFQEVREKQGLVYQIGSSYPPMEWQGCFSISLMSTRQNHQKVLDSLDREIQRLKSEIPDGDEVDRARTYLKGTFLMSQERCSDQAFLLARYHSLGLGIEFIDKYPVLLDEVTPEDIRANADAYLNHPVLAIVGPGNGAS